MPALASITTSIKVAVTIAAAFCFVLLKSGIGVAGADGKEANSTSVTTSVESEYRLGAQDRIRVRVYEWRPSLDQIFDWSALNSEYDVQPSGKVALPLAGEIAAGGLATGELAAAIGRRLQERMGLATVPDTSVEVVQFRPVYVLGDVEKPGECPYRPGMTVLQAVSVGGGILRDKRGAMRLERDALTSIGELDLLANERNALLLRRARLKVEYKGDEQIAFPADFLPNQRTDPVILRLFEQEQLMFTARKVAFNTQITALRKLKDYLEKQVTSLHGQLAAHQKQISLLETELVGIDSLAEKGLVTAPRKFGAESRLAQLESDRLKLESEVMRAQQEISKTDIAMIELTNKRQGDVTTEMQQTQIRLEQIETSTQTARKLLYEAQVIAPLRLVDPTRNLWSEPEFKVVRLVNGVAVEIAASQSTALLPGDTVKVELPKTSEDVLHSQSSRSDSDVVPFDPGAKRALLE